ncbi:MAG: Signal transduction histidine kinase CheA [Labilithrix sp.]|nr:Signal transduction histidine kinase CheA [Labilithrix sp.]
MLNRPGYRLVPDGGGSNELDLGTALAISQAIARELILEDLVRTLMTLALEHAGAGRAALLLPKGEDLRVEADAKTTPDGIVFEQHPPSGETKLAENVLAFVLRTRSRVVIDDAASPPHGIETDDYLREAAGFILALPLLDQSQLRGVLYLENKLARGPFTRRQLDVLDVLASQAATSLENARRYADLEAHAFTESSLADVMREATLGEMTASISHEINQPLAAISMNASACIRWLTSSTPNLNEACEAAHRLSRDANRASSLVVRLRGLFKKAGARKPIDLNEAIDELLIQMRAELRKSSCVVRKELATELPRVLGDRVQLQQVAMNLMLNGIEAMLEVHDRPRELVVRTELDADGHVHIAVQDVGVGIAEDDLPHVFEPFHTTKAGRMGLGLSISRTLVGSHGGRLWATRDETPGTTFHFTVPSVTAG